MRPRSKSQPRSLEIERDHALVGVEHGERQRGAAWPSAVAQAVAVGRLDLDDVGARHGQQERAIGPGIDARQIDHADAVQRPGSGPRTSMLHGEFPSVLSDRAEPKQISVSCPMAGPGFSVSFH
jgi:hypothetical protein